MRNGGEKRGRTTPIKSPPPPRRTNPAGIRCVYGQSSCRSEHGERGGENRVSRGTTTGGRWIDTHGYSSAKVNIWHLLPDCLTATHASGAIWKWREVKVAVTTLTRSLSTAAPCLRAIIKGRKRDREREEGIKEADSKSDGSRCAK